MTEDLPTGPSQPTDYDKVRAKEDAARVERNRQATELLTIMEPKSYGNSAVSQAISLKRIADTLERILARIPMTSYASGGAGGGSPYIAGGGGTGDPATFTGAR